MDVAIVQQTCGSTKPPSLPSEDETGRVEELLEKSYEPLCFKSAESELPSVRKQFSIFTTA